MGLDIDYSKCLYGRVNLCTLRGGSFHHGKPMALCLNETKDAVEDMIQWNAHFSPADANVPGSMAF